MTTTVHRVNLSDDAYHMIAYMMGMFIGAELSGHPFHVRSEEEGKEIYVQFADMMYSRFGFPSTKRFTETFAELTSQFTPRPHSHGSVT
jgi:hypothetical protein